ncbi:MAG: protease inhibitor I42 family protein [Bacteroidales bacterium]|nr:protease inhibitor I42 family protein [Bacteroidales bacterium]
MKHSIDLLVFAVLLATSSCAGIQFDRQYKVNKGEEFVINLKTNPSTGYTWMIEEGLSDSLVILQGEEYVPDENPSGKPRLGSGGIKKWHFEAVKEGKTLLKFIYKRPGTEETSEIKQFQIMVK